MSASDIEPTSPNSGPFIGLAYRPGSQTGR
jgi:hypothetical protein